MVPTATVDGWRRRQQSRCERMARHVGGSVLGLGLVVGGLFAAERGWAQDRQGALDPRVLATATRTERGGVFQLDGGNIVYVPQQCVGARRCPLIVGGSDIDHPITPGLGEKYGMIALTNQNIDDEALKETLRKFAVDPDKIALVVLGDHDKKDKGLSLGVFSRIALYNVDAESLLVEKPKPGTQYLLISALRHLGHNLRVARTLRERGAAVEHAARVDSRARSYDLIGHWLQKSWAIPDPRARPAPRIAGEPALLTADALTQLAAFWNYGPSSLRLNASWMSANWADIHEVAFPIGAERISVWMDDMSVLATRYPALAAVFTTTRLTVRQYDAYLVALIGAQLAKASGSGAGDPTSMLAKNITYLQTNPDVLKTSDVEQMGWHMWEDPWKTWKDKP